MTASITFWAILQQLLEIKKDIILVLVKAINKAARKYFFLKYKCFFFVFNLFT